jgi:hypothetical protein
MFFKLNFVNFWVKPFREALSQIIPMCDVERDEDSEFKEELKNLQEKYEKLKSTNKLLKNEKFKLQQEKEFIVFSFNELYDVLKVEKDMLDLEVYELNRELRYSEECEKLERQKVELKMRKICMESDRLKAEAEKLKQQCEVSS